MKNLLFVAIIYITTISLSFAKINSAALSGWYYACKDAGYTHSYCRCNVETMDQKLSNRQFEKIFVHEQWKIADWMKDNVIPVCGLGEK